MPLERATEKASKAVKQRCQKGFYSLPNLGERLWLYLFEARGRALLGFL